MLRSIIRRSPRTPLWFAALHLGLAGPARLLGDCWPLCRKGEQASAFASRRVRLPWASFRYLVAKQLPRFSAEPLAAVHSLLSTGGGGLLRSPPSSGPRPKLKKKKSASRRRRPRPSARDDTASNRRANKPRGTKNSSATTCVERGSTMRCWIFRPRANPLGRARGRGGQRTAGRDAAAALEERIKAPRPGCQSAHLCRIGASVGFGVDHATAGGS